MDRHAVRPDEIGAAYDRIAERWSADDFPRDNGIAAHRRAIAFLTDRRTALDIGCGSSGRIIDLLIAEGFTVAGVDVSARMVELARQRHPGIDIHHADVCEWTFPGTYDLISAWDSIWHVPLGDQARLLRKILAALNPKGVCIFTMGGVDRPEEITDTYMGPRVYYGSLGIPGTLALVAESGCICRHLEYDQYPERHVYLIVQRA